MAACGWIPASLKRARLRLSSARFGAAASEKSSYNVFAQNPWYLGKLAGTGRLPTLRRLIDNQQDFISTFAEIVRRPQEQEEVLRDLAVRCLAG